LRAERRYLELHPGFTTLTTNAPADTGTTTR
jgi:hypothetical protein